MNLLSVAGRTLLVAVLLLLCACGSNPIVGDGITDLTLKIVIAEDVNPDENGRASPVFLQVIQLRDTNSFDNADYLDLYQDASAALGAAWLHSTEIGPMFPGTTRTEKLRLNAVSTAVGLLGEFNRFSDMQTSQTVVIDPGKDKKVTVVIDGSGVHLN